MSKTRQAVSRTAKPRRQAIVRKGKNLSGNKPYVGKIYFIAGKPNPKALEAAPPQVQAIATFMARTHIKARGGDIIQAAKKAGVLKTKIKDPRVLFGFYARELQKVGAKAQYERG